MILNERKMISILKEEYDKRLLYCLLERLQLKTSDDIDVWENADQLKVRHEASGIEFTFVRFEGDNVILNMPEESRLQLQSTGSSLIPEIDFISQREETLNDEGFIANEEDYIESEEDKDQVIVPKEVFEKDFTF